MLHVHRADRADGLIAALAGLLAKPLADPFAAETIAVPTRGMERWLTQQLSARLGTSDDRLDGVCANVDFPFPRRIVSDAVAAATGVEPDDDPWRPERLVWPLVEVVDAHLGEPWLERLAAYLGHGADPPDAVRRARRLGIVRHLAALFDRYALHRPEMVLGWAAREGEGWQPELWRRLRERIGQPGPAERLEDATARLHQDPALLDLPPRLSLFGLTRLPAGHLRVLNALAVHRDVHLFLLHPSPALWEAIAGRAPASVISRADDPTADLPRHPLLASWGRDAREMQLVLRGADADHVDHHHPVEHHQDTLLARIQADVRADREPTAHAPDPTDRSVEVHACHGQARQVEVLRDAILHALQEDPSLEPRDVIVMCPDIEAFAPLIGATFGAGELAPGDELDGLPADAKPVDLRVRLADRSLRQTNPTLGVVAALLELADQRVTASQLLDLADREPVRRRFRLDDDDLTRLQDWIAESGIRWGLDAAHRAPFRLQSLASGTWASGLDRLLAGVTMTEDHQRLIASVLPLDDVESGAIDLTGRFAELVARLQTAIDALSTPQPIDAWTRNLAAAADALTTTSQRDAWQRAELQRLLDAVATEADASATDLALAEVRGLLAERLQGRPTRANFRTGHLTICTLVPMRSVPHRVVCLLGLDDGAFPRKAPRDGDDLMLDDPRLGERDPRAEDRQQLLDALLAATDKLIVTYTGNDERTNAPRPPAVPVGELLDVVAASGTPRKQVLVRHPLQPFDPRNFEPDRLTPGRTWSFDAVTLEGARTLTHARPEPGSFLAGPLPDLDSDVIELDALVRFVQHPVGAFLRNRLGISLADFSEEVRDGLPVELDGLGQWAVGQRLLDARLAGIDGRTAKLAEIARGTLPPRYLGAPLVGQIEPVVNAIVAEAGALVAGDDAVTSRDVRVALPDGRSLRGTVPGVTGELVRAVTYSRVAPKQRLASWVRLLALTATEPDRGYWAATVGRATGSGTATIALIDPLHDAHEHLAALVDLFDRGMREPLPMACKASAAYAERSVQGGDPRKAGRAEWESGFKWDKEDKELEHQLVLGGVRSFDELLAAPARPDERWHADEATRFGQLARRLWSGLLGAETVTHR